MHPTEDSDSAMCIIPRSQTPWYDAHPKVGVHNGTLRCASSRRVRLCIVHHTARRVRLSRSSLEPTSPSLGPVYRIFLCLIDSFSFQLSQRRGNLKNIFIWNQTGFAYIFQSQIRIQAKKDRLRNLDSNLRTKTQ